MTIFTSGLEVGDFGGSKYFLKIRSAGYLIYKDILLRLCKIKFNTSKNESKNLFPPNSSNPDKKYSSLSLILATFPLFSLTSPPLSVKSTPNRPAGHVWVWLHYTNIINTLKLNSGACVWEARTTLFQILLSFDIPHLIWIYCLLWISFKKVFSRIFFLKN